MKECLLGIVTVSDYFKSFYTNKIKIQEKSYLYYQKLNISRWSATSLQRPADRIPQRDFGHLRRAAQGGRSHLHLPRPQRRGLLGEVRPRSLCHG
jgi:hypothetical protein